MTQKDYVLVKVAIDAYNDEMRKLGLSVGQGVKGYVGGGLRGTAVGGLGGGMAGTALGALGGLAVGGPLGMLAGGALGGLAGTGVGAVGGGLAGSTYKGFQGLTSNPNQPQQ